MLDDTTAEITLRGTLINEAEDLVHTDVNFVVGVPNFVHRDFLAPIAVGQIIRTSGGSVAPPTIQSQVMNRAAVASDRRGEKSIVTLMVKRVKYSHLYRWSVPEPLRHSLVLHHQTDAAWTTGPVLLVSDGQPLSQDLLAYTPMKGDGEIPVTAASNISHDRRESESERTVKDVAVGQETSLDLVTIDGLLQLKNFEQRAVRVVVTAPVPGKPIAAGDGGDLSVDPGKLILRERCGSIRWDLTLGPGEKQELSCRYERYVPSH